MKRFSRRDFLGTSLGAGAALALTPDLLRAFEQSGGLRQAQAVPSLSRDGKLIQRAIPSSGEMLPVIGVQFRNNPSMDPVALKDVLRTLVDNGATFVDTMHQSVDGVEDQTAKVVTELGIQNKLFLALRALPSGPPTPGAETPTAKVEALLAKFKVAKVDLLQLPVQADPAQLPVLKEMKKQGRIRYMGMTVITDARYPALEAIMRDEPIDFIGVDYAVDNRNAEEKLLPLALERKIGVVAYFPSAKAPSSNARAPHPFRSGPPSSTRRRGRSSSSNTSSATQPSPSSVRGRSRRRTCSRTSAAASGDCRMRRRATAWPS